MRWKGLFDLFFFFLKYVFSKNITDAFHWNRISSVSFLCRWVLLCLCSESDILWCSKSRTPSSFLIVDLFGVFLPSFSLISNQKHNLSSRSDRPVTSRWPHSFVLPFVLPAVVISRGLHCPTVSVEIADRLGTTSDPNMWEMRQEFLSRNGFQGQGKEGNDDYSKSQQGSW